MMTTDFVKEQHLLQNASKARALREWSASARADKAMILEQKLEEAYRRIQEQEERIALLEEAATTDELTGLCNRRGFYTAFLGEIDRTSRGLTPGGLLVLIDLDNFKSINDTYGHLAGDAALRLVGRALKGQVRPMDVAARLGGDEFVLLFAGASKAQAAARAQALAWNLNHLSLQWQGEEIPVRASLGLKEFKPGDRAEQIFSAADHALYEQKRTRTEMVQPNPEEGDTRAL